MMPVLIVELKLFATMYVAVFFVARHMPVHAGIHPPRRRGHAGIDMATAADGTHPTGMHACFFGFFCKGWVFYLEQDSCLIVFVYLNIQ